MDSRNSIFELLKSHCCIFDKNLQNVKLPVGTDKFVNWIFQLDYLQRYPSSEKISLYGLPWSIESVWVKDNPNWIPTEFSDVFLKVEYFGEHCAIDYQLIIPWKSPISIINWWYFKVREWNNVVWKWRITVYWKALKLYYMGYIQRLQDYVIKYNWQCCRVDLCWDFPCEFPDWIVDLQLTWSKYDTKYFGRDNSNIFFRKYNKTKDLRKDKNCYSWFYPKWYMKECWRLEAQLTWRYSKSMAPNDWLDIMEVDKSIIQKLDKIDRSVYKTALYSVINTVDWINLSVQEKLNILINSKRLLEQKIKKLKEQDL